jgi:hypothetical protein
MLSGGHSRNNPSSTIIFLPAKCVGASKQTDRRRPVSIWWRTHWAPVQLLPAPRPAHSSHNLHGGGGGVWCGWRQNAQLYSKLVKSCGDMPASSSRRCSGDSSARRRALAATGASGLCRRLYRRSSRQCASTNGKALKMRQCRCIYTPMQEPLITTKITPTALRLLRLVAASTGEKQYEVMDRLLADEAKRLGLRGGRR